MVRFDFTGLGKSEGGFTESHLSANIEDLIEVNNYLERHYKALSLLIGHSLGGATAIVAASKLENIKTVSTIGAPITVEHITHLFLMQLNKSLQREKLKYILVADPSRSIKIL